MNILIIGASRGLGHALAAGLAGDGRHLMLLSRSQPQVLRQGKPGNYTWIKADVAAPDFTSMLKAAVQQTPIDVLIYNAAIWEQNAFRPNYSLDDDSEDYLRAIISVNLTGAILAVQALLPNLHKAAIAKIIFIGSTSGAENNRTLPVAYAASKFGLRGVNNALRENFRGTNIHSTILNLGNLSTTIPFEEGKEKALEKSSLSAIPLQEVVDMVQFIIGLSGATLVKEMDIPCHRDESL